MRLNGPELTGLEFVNVAGSFTFDQTLLGTTNCRLRMAGMNCESGVFSRITTVYAPAAPIERMLLPVPVRPMRSIVLSCRPAVRLYTASAAVTGLPFDHFAFLARWSVSVLLPLLHFQLRASHGIVLLPPAGTTISGSYIAPWTNALLGRPPPAYGLKLRVKAGSPDPVITRHLWAALTLTARTPSFAAGAVELTRRTETPTRPATATAVAYGRVERRLRRIRLPFSPGDLRAARLRPVGRETVGRKCSGNV